MIDSNSRATRRSVIRTGGVLAVGGVTGLAGCTGDGGGDGDSGDSGTDGQETTATTPPPTDVVHGAVEGGTTGVLVNVMDAREFDLDNGIRINPKHFTSPPQVQRQIVLNDDIPTGFMGSIVATRLTAEGHDPRLVGPYMLYHMYVLTRADSDISGPEDLDGKRISWASEAADAWLKFEVILNEDVGITPDDLRFQQAAPPASINLLEQGELDAILLHEPLVTKALSQFDFEVVYSPREIWDEIEDLPLTTVDLAWNDPWYQNNESAAAGLARATRDTQAYIQSNVDDVIENNQDVFGLENDDQVALAKERLDRIYPTEWNREAFVNSEMTVARKARELGLVDNAPSEEIFTWVL